MQLGVEIKLMQH